MHWSSAGDATRTRGSASAQLFGPGIDTRAADGQSLLSLGWDQSTRRKEWAGPAMVDSFVLCFWIHSCSIGDRPPPEENAEPEGRRKGQGTAKRHQQRSTRGVPAEPL